MASLGLEDQLTLIAVYTVYQTLFGSLKGRDIKIFEITFNQY